MEVKVLCSCEQKYKFDVDPVDGQMPFPVNCPSCGADGTAAANAVIAQFLPVAAPVAAPAAAVRVTRHVAVAPAAPPPPVPSAAPPGRPAVVPRAAAGPPRADGEFSLGKGIAGALLGGALGAGIMFGLSVAVGFRFPFLGVGIGAMTGYGAKLLFKGTDTTLGFISGAVALVSVGGTLYLIYGELFLTAIISMLISVSVAYRVASG